MEWSTKADKQMQLILKTLADDTRLQMLRVLAGKSHNVGELALALQLSEPTISHHLSRMREAGLVTLRTVGNQRIYSLNLQTLAGFKAMIAFIEQIPSAPSDERDDAWIDALAWSDADKTVLREHTLNGRLLRVPKQAKKLLVILRWLATHFEKDKRYTEREVNAILTPINDDYALLRRDLVDFGFLERETSGKSYWRSPDAPELTT